MQRACIGNNENPGKAARELLSVADVEANKNEGHRKEAAIPTLNTFSLVATSHQKKKKTFCAQYTCEIFFEVSLSVCPLNYNKHHFFVKIHFLYQKKHFD